LTKLLCKEQSPWVITLLFSLSQNYFAEKIPLGSLAQLEHNGREANQHAAQCSSSLIVNTVLIEVLTESLYDYYADEQD
jgi:hypothetical protein